jgi:hypothetical protein
MLEADERAFGPGVGRVRGAKGSGVGQELNVGPRRSQRDRLLLEVDLGALIVGIGKGADQEESHRI